MKFVTAILTGVFVTYAIWQSYLIANTGAIYQIPQLEGDGGGGLIFAGLCLIAGFIVLFRPLLSGIMYLLAAVLISFVAMAFQDKVEFLWTVIAMALAALAVVSRYRSKQRLHKANRKPGNKKTALHR